MVNSESRAGGLGALVDLCVNPLPAAHRFPGLETTIDPDKPGARGRICFISTELVGARSNGGIGTAQCNLAKTLAAAGHQVTILFFRKPDRPLTEELRAYYAKLGIAIVQDDDFGTDFYGRGRIRYPLGTYEWLKSQDFDVVHAPELHAYLYFALLAKKLGLAFAKTMFVVGTHCSSEWLSELNHTPLSEKDHLVASFMERASVALADTVWSPSRYLLEWMRAANWPVGANCHFHPLASLPYESLPATAASAGQPVSELVFFGRLQRRKGIELFCDAIDRLQPVIAQLGRPFKVTFLGDNQLAAFGLPADFHERRASAWKHEWQLIEDYDVERALGYLRGPGRVAVIPSLSDNSPNTIYECLLYGVPFAASMVGGIPELVAEEEHGRVLFAPRAADCARILADIVRAPVRPVKPAFDFETVKANWARWHDQAVAAMRGCEAPAAAPTAKITVCIPHFNRTRLLWQALHGLEGQSYGPFEVIVVDDGSTNPEDVRELEKIEAWLAERGWRLIRQENAFPSAARNRATQEAKGDHVFFLDDDDVLAPNALDILARAAAFSGADILHPIYMSFASPDAPGPDTPVPSRYVALGGGLALAGSWSVNSFGGISFLARRETFLALGGFTTDYGIGNEDWEFLIRAELAGHSLYQVPEALVWVRKSEGGLQDTADRFRDNRRSLRPLIEQALPWQRLLLMYSQDVGRERDQYRDAAYALAWERDQLQGRLKVLEQALDSTQKINDMLLDKIRDGVGT